MNGIDNIYVINLDRDNQRLVDLQSQFDNVGLSFERVSGVYGKDLTDKQLEQNVSKLYRKFGPKSAIGCAMSHMKVWQRIVDNNDQVALILEDDVVFTDNFLEKFNSIFPTVPNDFDILYLGCINSCNINKKFDMYYSITKNILFKGKYTKPFVKINDHVFEPPLPLAAHAYIITNKTARYLLENFKKDLIKFHVDVQMVWYTYYLRVYCIYPHLINQENVNVNSSNNTATRFPFLINKLLDNIVDGHGFSYNYFLTVGLFEVNGYSICGYTISFFLIGMILALLGLDLSSVMSLIVLYLVLELKFHSDYTSFIKDAVIMCAIILVGYILIKPFK